MRIALWHRHRSGPAPTPSRPAVHPRVYVLRRTARAVQQHRVLDLAAGLTYFAVLAVVPAGIAFVSLLSLLGQSKDLLDQFLAVVAELGPGSTVDTVQRIVDLLPPAPSAGTGLVLGLIGAIWSASAYVGAFARAMNRLYGVHEGRAYWRFRPQMFLVTLLVLALGAVVAVSFVTSGPLARFIGRFLEIEAAMVDLWEALRWPLVILLMILVVAALYYLTPNVRRRFRWISQGATVAILGWLVGSAGFNYYVTHFGNYDAAYGALAGLVVFLLWLWISNIVLLVGAALDVEIMRLRQLRTGITAEATLHVVPRDTSAIDKRAAQTAEDIALGRAIRESAALDVEHGHR